MKTEFSFWSTGFNCTEPQAYFINNCCFGDDLCRWLITELSAAGYPTDAAPGQEDFGWFFNFEVGNLPHTVVISFQPNCTLMGNCWLGVIERDPGFFWSLFGKRNRGINPEAVSVIDRILKSNSTVSHINWH